MFQYNTLTYHLMLNNLERIKKKLKISLTKIFLIITIE